MIFGHLNSRARNFALVAGTFAFLTGGGLAAHANETVTVYKPALCGCCEKWADHLRKAGFDIEVVNMADVTPVKDEAGVPMDIRSCHTAKFGGYWIEGHVPVGDIMKLMAEKPTVLGIAVPGMPAGSPGMEFPGQKGSKYFSVLFDSQGKIEMFVGH